VLSVIETMIHTCASCAARIPQTAPRCGNCKTRYCGRDCQKRHWKGGHKQICDQIKRRGGAEQCHAEKQYKDAVAVAVAKCADDTKGQTCYICTEALHWKTKEGLVRMCACRGTAGFAHVSCLAEQAKLLNDEAEENNMDIKVKNARFDRWHKCSLCEQGYHGVVLCALGWACWKTYLGQPEGDWSRVSAMMELGNGLHGVGKHEERLGVLEAEMAALKRRNLHAAEGARSAEIHVLRTKNNTAVCYQNLGRHEEALGLRREVHAAFRVMLGESHEETLIAAHNLGLSFIKLKRFAEAKSTLLTPIADARRTLGDDHATTLDLRDVFGEALALNEEMDAATAIYEDIIKRSRRLLGAQHFETQRRERMLKSIRDYLAMRARFSRPA
jgi:tetratricopeptide (TPR) repeat protein